MIRLLRHLTFCLMVIVAGALVTPGAGLAQSPQSEPNYVAWEQVATRAENAIDAARASTAALEALRTELVTWRDRFDDAQAVNASAIETVRAQLSTLGPVPEGGTESEDVAAQRQGLNDRLGRLMAPVTVAELAFSRANGLISGVDRIIRGRQTDALLQIGPSPVNPVHWGPAIGDLTTTATNIRSEIRSALDNPVQSTERRQGWPAVIGLSLIGLVLLLRGRYWADRLSRALWAHRPSAARWIVSFVVSLGEILLPVLGVMALSEAIFAADLAGLRGSQFISALLPASLYVYGAIWLGHRVFPRFKLQALPLVLDDDDRQRGRRLSAMLGILLALVSLITALAQIDAWSEATRNVWLFPLLVTASIVLIQVARLLRRHVASDAELDDAEESFRDRLLQMLSGAMLVLAVVSPVLGAVGYMQAAQAMMVPSILSLGLIAALLILQKLVSELYVMISGNRERLSESLIPVVFGFGLVLLSLPLFALIWGARVADLSELWTQFTQGIRVGETRISPAAFLTFAMVFGLGYMATRLVQGALKNTVLPKTRLDPGGRNAVVSGTGYVGIFLAALIAISSAGIDLSNIAIVAGALSVGIGFGLQNIVSNFVSGIILLIERPITEGDWIEVGGTHGTVRDISVRSTRIETFDRSDVIVPNADLVSGTVTNYTRGKTVGRIILPVGVAYGTNTRRVHEILQEIAEGHPMVLANPAPYVVFSGFGADSLDFEIRAILRDINWGLSVRTELNHQISERFEAEGIEIPFAQRDIWIRNPEALSGKDTPADRPVSTPVSLIQDDPDATSAPDDDHSPEEEGER